MAKKKKLTHAEAKKMLETAGVDFHKDVYEQSYSNMDLVAATAKAAGYRKSKNAPGSTGRMYYQLLQRTRG